MENPSVGFDTGAPPVPQYLQPKRIFASDKAYVPRELIKIRRTRKNAAAALELWLFLADFCSRQKPCCYHSDSTLAKNLGVSKRTIQFAWDALEAEGFVERVTVIRQGLEYRIVYCLWLIPDDGKGENVDFGSGHQPRVEDVTTQTPRAGRFHQGEAAPFFAPDGTKVAPRSSGALAPDPAPNVDSGINSTSTLTETSTFVDEGSGSPESQDQADPPAVAPPEVTSAAEAAALFAGPFGRTAPLMATLIWELVDARREAEIPPRFAGEKRPPRPEPAAPPAPPVARAAASPVSAPASGPIEKLQTQTLLNRIATAGVEAAEPMVVEVADRQARDWDDAHSWHCFRLKLRLLAQGLITLEAYWAAFRAAEAAQRGEKGKAFNGRLKARMVELRREGKVV